MSIETKSDKNDNSKSGKVSKKYYGVAKSREPWYLKLIFWLLIGVLVIGGTVTSYFIVINYKINKEALGVEIKVMKMLMEFENNLQDEKEKIDVEKYDDAHDIALENLEVSIEIKKYIDQYFMTFDENIEGYNKVLEYKTKFEELSEDFYELNKTDPRLLKDN